VVRVAIELINPEESDVIVSDRASRQVWLEARGYRVVSMAVADVERDLAAELDRLEASLPGLA
jgi:tRNA/rRNA methyltransferase